MLLEDLQVILKVAEFKSITGAATALDMRPATASAAVKRVEVTLGTELFIRTTRQLRLSNAGERYLPECEKALRMLDIAKQNMQEDQDIIDGEIRIALSSDLGRNLIAPWLDEFMHQHPNVTLRASISDSNIDLYRDSVDMALRYGSPNDASLYGFKICDVPRLLCASAEYLQRNGAPKCLDDLTTHNALLYQLHDTLEDTWKFSDSHGEYKVKLKGDRSSNDGDLVRRWCVSGKGIAVKSCLDMSQDLVSNRVVNVMPEFKPTPTELWLICPSKQSITPMVRQLRDLFRSKTLHILQQLSDEGVLD